MVRVQGAERDLGGVPGDRDRKMGPQKHADIVRQAQNDFPGKGRRVELRMGERAAEPGKRISDLRPEDLGPGGGRHTGRGPFKQAVPRDVAQPRHGLADRGLGPVQPFPRLAQIALGHDRVEDDQQIEV